MQFMKWMRKDDWSKQICEVHQIEAKQRIAYILHNSFTKEGEGVVDELTVDEYTSKQTLRTNIALQILSVCYELTEDLAATCASYAKALTAGNKNVPEYLRDFGNPGDFYTKASKEICYAADMSGLDPITDVVAVVGIKDLFNKITNFRTKYYDWYQGYKHGQRTIPMYAWPTNEAPTTKNVKAIVYRIPIALQVKGDSVFTELDFLDAITDESTFINLIDEIVVAWQNIKQRQFNKLFPNPQTVTPQQPVLLPQNTS